MPQGIIATIDDGYATVEFVDPALRGPALASVIEDAGPGVIETITRKGPRRKYRMPVGNATAAGLVDGTEPSEDYTAGPDQGAAEAWRDADPNVNPGADHANWHTPTAEHTSANAFVGQVPNAAVLHGRPKVFTGLAAAIGVPADGHPPTHRELIDAVKGVKNPTTTQTTGQTGVHPAAEANGRLGQQPGALFTDPGGIPDGAPHPLDGIPVHANTQPHALMALSSEGLDGDEITDPEGAPGDTELQGDGTQAQEPATPPSEPAPANPAPTAEPRPDGLPEGEPNDEWTRGQLNVYAAWKGVESPGTLPNKDAVLAAIAAKVQENQ